jgi:hypothetical protein
MIDSLEGCVKLSNLNGLRVYDLVEWVELEFRGLNFGFYFSVGLIKLFGEELDGSLEFGDTLVVG